MSSTVRSPRSSKRRAADTEPISSPKSPRKARGGKNGDVATNEAPKPADPTHSSKMHTLIVRSITGLVMMLGFTLILLSNHALVAAFVVLLQIMVYREMTSLRYSVAKEKEIPFFRSLNWCVFYVSSSSIRAGNERTVLPLTHVMLPLSYCISELSYPLRIMTNMSPSICGIETLCAGCVDGSF